MMNNPTIPVSPSDQNCCPVVELRQYTLHPEKRDVLIELFDREFVESQEALGMKVIGQFRDLDDPNRFVWLRGFRDMASRAKGLQDFYGGPVWKAHREVANSAMIDSDNVLLLRPVDANAGFPFAASDRLPLGINRTANGLLIATIYDFDAPVDKEFTDFFDETLRPLLVSAGASIVACLMTESSPNNFPALPVREGENVYVWFSRFPGAAAYERYLAELARSPRWGGEISEELMRRLKGHPQTLKLAPTARSQLTA
jgi:NIPSNAP